MDAYLLAPALAPYVRQLWYSDTPAQAGVRREHVLPTGQMHLVFRLAGPPLRVFGDAADATGTVLREPVVGGARTSYYAKESGLAVTSVGVQLLPGAAMSLFGVSAAELAGRHTGLSDLWGTQAEDALAQLADARTGPAALATLARLLEQRLPRIQAMHPAVAHLLSQPARFTRIDALVRESDYSHRGFIALFRQATGMSPKRYARLMRFRTLLAALRKQPTASLGMLALDAGYSDQAHMNREFRAFAGVTPHHYLLLDPVALNHVPLP